MGRFMRNKGKKKSKEKLTLDIKENVKSKTRPSLLKTLIVFDTNMLREMLGKDVAYHKFTFGKSYNELKDFIVDNGLSDYVNLTVSTMVIEELKKQKKKAYLDDIRNLKEIIERLKGLPHINKDSMQIPNDDFDCEAFVEENARRFIEENAINTLTLEEKHANSILSNMIKKVTAVDSPDSPFAKTKHYSDAGFKDGIIWETLMHYEKVQDFNKVIFLSKDGDYKQNCIDDFKAKWNRFITIEKGESNVIAELKKDYGDYINEREIYNFAESDYFRQYLFELLKEKSEIAIDGVNLKIENFSITNLCAIVGRKPPTDDEDERIVIYSEIEIFFTQEKQKKELFIKAETILADDISKDIIETTFEPELR